MEAHDNTITETKETPAALATSIGNTVANKAPNNGAADPVIKDSANKDSATKAPNNGATAPVNKDPDKNYILKLLQQSISSTCPAFSAPISVD